MRVSRGGAVAVHRGTVVVVTAAAVGDGAVAVPPPPLEQAANRATSATTLTIRRMRAPYAIATSPGPRRVGTLRVHGTPPRGRRVRVERRNAARLAVSHGDR